MKLRDYYSDHYSREATRRNELTNSLSLPLGILSLLIGGLVVMAQTIHLPIGAIALLQLALIGIAVLFVLATAYFLGRSYYSNYEYGYAPTAQEIKDFKAKLVTYYTSIGDTPDVAESKAETEAIEHLDSQHAIHADRNHQNNNRKSYFIYMANGTLIAAIASTLVAGSAFFYTSISRVPEVPVVKVLNFSEIKMPNPPSPTPPAQQPSTGQSQPAPAPTKPEPPPGRLIREHTDPLKKR